MTNVSIAIFSSNLCQLAKKKQTTVPHPFRVILRNGWETTNSTSKIVLFPAGQRRRRTTKLLHLFSNTLSHQPLDTPIRDHSVPLGTQQKKVLFLFRARL